MEQKQEKQEIVPKNFDTIYSAVNARLKKSNNRHLFDSFLNSPRVKLSQSDDIILDNRDTKESFVDFVCEKTPIFQTFILLFWKQLNFLISLLLTRIPKQKTEKIGSLSKFEKVRQNRLYSRGRAAYGFIQNFSKASGLFKKTVE